MRFPSPPLQMNLNPAPPATKVPPDAPPEAAPTAAVRDDARHSWREATGTFLRRFFRALAEDETYDIRSNPTLWVGFLVALPIPIVTWAAGGPLWLLLVSIPAPVFWGVVLGAAGRVGVLTELEARRLAEEVDLTRSEAKAARESFEVKLGEEVERRTVLERRDEQVTSELKLAQSVHRTLVPDDIQRDDVEVAVHQVPSKFVGGDFLYAAVAADRWLYLIVGDVSGHGVSAALVVARIHGLIRRLTLALRSRPLTVLEKVNKAAMAILKHTYFFMTFGVFRLDLETGMLRYATAGHPPQVLLRHDGKLEELQTRNRLLGMDPDVFDAKRPAGQIHLDPGDTLVLFTDGVFEIPSDQNGEILGEEGLHARLANFNGLAPQLLAGEVLQELADFQGRSTFEDDVSLMVATYRGRPAPPTP